MPEDIENYGILLLSQTFAAVTFRIKWSHLFYFSKNIMSSSLFIYFFSILVHRIGRTGRSGRKGMATTFINRRAG